MKHLALMENVILPALLLAAGVVVVQAHAIVYWQERMGWAVGLVASLAAEAVGLYLVYQPGRLARAAGLLLVAVMVLVPAWQIAGPEYRAWRGAAEVHTAHVARQSEARATLPVLEADIAAQERSLREDEAKSRTRAGWLDELLRMRSALEVQRAERRRLAAQLGAPVPAGYDAWSALPIVLPVLALLIAFQAVNAYAVRRISGWRHRGIAKPPPVEIVESEPDFRVDTAHGNNGNVPMEIVDSLRIATPTRMEIAEGIAAPGDGNSSSLDTVETPAEMETSLGNLSLDDFTIRRLQEAVRDHVRKEKLTGKAFCERLRIQPRDLSLFMRHFEHRKAGRRTAPEAVMQRLALHFFRAAQSDAGLS